MSRVLVYTFLILRLPSVDLGLSTVWVLSLRLELQNLGLCLKSWIQVCISYILFEKVTIIVTHTSLAIRKLVTESDVCRSHSSPSSCHNHQQNIFASVLKRVAENRENDGMSLLTRCCASVCPVRSCRKSRMGSYGKCKLSIGIFLTACVTDTVKR